MKCPRCGEMWFDSDDEYSMSLCSRCEMDDEDDEPGPSEDETAEMIECALAGPRVRLEPHEIGPFLDRIGSDDKETP